ncbi:MAG: hypothetical protein IMZ66_10285, partial [Planctomycetes bacterium]|nr:hypothetical protein [Planctomycetota bacterium]
AWDPPRAWRALLINFIYFTPLAAGMVTWPAVLTLARGTWFAPVERPALAAVAFAPVSLAALAALWFGRTHWAAWMHETDLHNAAWLNETFLFARDAAALVVLWAVAVWFVRGRRRGRPKAPAAWLVLAYAVVFTLLAFDLVMALDPHWFSALFGGYFFISGMYTAVAAWTLSALLSRPAPERGRRHDLGRLLVAFSLLTMYMMFSQLIVIWYGNLPDEVRFVIPRLNLLPWRWVSAALLGVIYLGPLVFLLPARAKQSPAYLGAAASVVLVGMWVERWWLVTPTLGGDPVIGPVEISITAAFVAALVLAMRWGAARLPRGDVRRAPAP